MPTLFDPVPAGKLRLANRIVMAPLTRNRSPNAIPRDLTATYYAQRADAGLIITEATAISQQGLGCADAPGLYEAAQIDGWRKVTTAVHAKGGKIVAQLWHVGRVSHTALQPGGGAPVAPSSIAAKARIVVNENGLATFVSASHPRALRTDEIPGIVDSYVAAARAAMDLAGFDGVEIHGANGYLLDQFLKDGSNHRTDEYGGFIENRARLMLEVTRAVVGQVGSGRVGVRLSPVTPANDAYDSDPQSTFAHVVKNLAQADLAYVHIIEGATGGPREIADRPFDYDACKLAYRQAGGQGAWMVNNGYDRQLAQAALNAGHDLVAFGSPYIANPDLVRRLREDAPWNAVDRSTLYGGGEKGYTDYPTLAQAE